MNPGVRALGPPIGDDLLIGDDLAVGAPFRVGVNYWPRRKAMGWWKAFDDAEVADEFDAIADLGMSLVRIFLLWEDFQPQPDDGLARGAG